MKFLAAWIAAALTTSVLGSIVSTQLVLADISGFGLDVPISLRLSITFQDLLGLGPALLMLSAASFLFAFPVAWFAASRIGGRPGTWYAMAGLTALPAAIILIWLILGVTLPASARSAPGMTLMALCSLAGGWVFYWTLGILGRDTEVTDV